MAEQTRATREAIRRQAAEWIVLGTDARAQRRAELEAWLAQAPEHRLAYARELTSWERLDALAGTPPLAAPVRRPGWMRWATAACMGCLLLGVLWWSGTSAPAYATAVGERRLVRLEDGSSVELNTDSKILVLFSDRQRKVRLVRGEAWFDIAPGRQPFVVTTDAAQFASAGSAMNVRIHADGTAVTVAAGQVRIQSPGAGARVPSRLDQGQEGWFTEAVATSYPVNDVQVRQRLAWQQDAIALDGRSLEQAAREFNRYNRSKLVVDDPSIAALQLAGYFRVNDHDGFVRAVCEAFPVKALRTDDGTVHLVRRPVGG